MFPRMDDQEWIDRVFAFLLASVVLDILLGPSQVPLNFWFVSSTLSVVLSFAYLVALGFVFFEPRQPWGHLAATALGVGFWLGRAGGFISFVLDGKTHLIPAVHERLAWVVLVVLWHIRSIRLIPARHLIRQLLQNEAAN